MKAHQDLEFLTQAYLDGTIAGDDVERLNALLLESAAARRAFAERLNLDSSIAAAAEGWLPKQRKAPRPLPFSAGMRWFALAACAAILVGGGIWWNSTPQSFAKVERSLGVSNLEPGTSLRGESYTITEGTLELLTALGARVVIEAPAEFRFESEQRLHMTLGRLAADVPPSAKGFTVITPSGDAVDLGTRFGVDVPAVGDSEIHVFEGEVIAKAAGANTEQSLLAGQALTMGGGTSAARNLRSNAFIQHDELREIAHSGIEDHRARAEQALASLREDPALIKLLDFESDHLHPGVFRTVQGRWPGSRAPEFVNDGDHLKLEVGIGQTWKQLTIAAWVRLDHLGALYQSLLHSDGWDSDDFGLVHWMVTHSTTMRFAMLGNTLAPGSNESEDYPDSRTPVLSSRGRWVHLATVYDSEAKTVRFYLNGRFDKESRQATTYPARIGSAQIGNWIQGERKLSGRIDEMVILGRTMDDAEVRELFDAGNPYL
jgi:hypothetical protein